MSFIMKSEVLQCMLLSPEEPASVTFDFYLFIQHQLILTTFGAWQMVILASVPQRAKKWLQAK